MCWESKKEPIKKVATENKTVYKLLSFDLRAPFYYYRYFYNEKQKEIELKFTERCTIFPAFKSYIIKNGYHSYSKLATVKNFQEINRSWMPLDIFICTIPKGSVYYENDDSEIVSSNIIINRKLDKNYKL